MNAAGSSTREWGTAQAPDDLLAYYQRELAYLREQGAEFATRYPRVAQRLALSGVESPDPHTERLIEAVAFLTGRVHQDVDREFPSMAAGLLEQLCPSLARPVPSMTVARLVLDPTQGKVTAGLRVARATGLAATSVTGETCRFQTLCEATLWPLQVAQVRLEDGRTLLVNLRCEPGVDASELELDTLRLHLAGDLGLTMPLYELLLTGVQAVEVVAADGTVRRLGPGALQPAGFAQEEPAAATTAAHPAYGLLLDYFAFPRKFQFFDLRGLRGALGAGEGFALRLVFDRSAPVLSQLGPEHLLTGCVPVANLFLRTSEPIRLDRRRHEYLLMPDRQRDDTTEVHSVLSVTATDTRADRPVRLHSVYSEPDPQALAQAQFLWTLRREASLRPGIAGTDVFIGFVDLTDVQTPASEPIVYAQVLCTNRRLAEQVPPGARLWAEGVPRSATISALYAPSAQREPALGTRALWSLVSLLRLNHRSLVDGTDGVQALREMLLLFAGGGAREQSQVRGIVSLASAPATARIGTDAWRGHCRGTDVNLSLDPDAFVGGSPLLLAGVLAHFFALYTTANSFVRLQASRRGEPWWQWPAMSGGQPLV